MEEIYEAFESKCLEPKINILNKSIFMMADRDSLERIVDNLLSNALKYGEKDIEIDLHKCDGKAILKISNTCTSIMESDVFHMFDRFYMVDQVRKGQGTGPGLSIVKSLMEKMNGVIIANLQEDKLYLICKWNLYN